MFIIISNNFIKYFTPKQIAGISIFPFVFVENKELSNNKIFINHEFIHLQQQLEMGIVFFYIWYVLEFFVKLVKYKNFYIAYEHISFEKEAYENENDLEYLTNRQWFSFLKYL